MGEEYSLDFQSGNFVTSTLDDVHGITAQDPIIPCVISLRDITRSKPARRFGRRLRFPEFAPNRSQRPQDLALQSLPWFFVQASILADSPNEPRCRAKGSPTVPGRRSPCSGFERAMPISVIP